MTHVTHPDLLTHFIHDPLSILRQTINHDKKCSRFPLVASSYLKSSPSQFSSMTADNAHRTIKFSSLPAAVTVQCRKLSQRSVLFIICDGLTRLTVTVAAWYVETCRLFCVCLFVCRSHEINEVWQQISRKQAVRTA